MGTALSEKWLRAEVDSLVGQIPPSYFQSKRWFGSKTRTIVGLELIDVALLEIEDEQFMLLLVELAYAGGDPELYQLPLAVKPAQAVPEAVKLQPSGVAFVLEAPEGDLYAYDAFTEDRFCLLLYQAMYDDQVVQMENGALVFHHVPGVLETRDVHTIIRVSTEQSNTSIIFDQRQILKGFRKLSFGLNPDFEVPYFLTTHSEFRNVPTVAGFVEYHPAAGGEISMGVMQSFVPHEGDGYNDARYRVTQYCEFVLSLLSENPESTPEVRAEIAAQSVGPMPELMHRLGVVTGEMHHALASDTDLAAFTPEPITVQDAEAWEGSIAHMIEETMRDVRERMPALAPQVRELLEPVLAHEAEFLAIIPGLRRLADEGCHKTRYHGDYHLGQVLKTSTDFMVLDFEGEPARPLEYRRSKQCPLKDVAGMLRSFDYAAYAVLFELWKERRMNEAQRARLEEWVLCWEQMATDAFLEGYVEVAGRHTGPRFMPAGSAAYRQLIQIFSVEKAFYELNYEFNNRPSWIPIPARGLMRLLERQAG